MSSTPSLKKNIVKRDKSKDILDENSFIEKGLDSLKISNQKIF